MHLREKDKKGIFKILCFRICVISKLIPIRIKSVFSSNFDLELHSINVNRFYICDAVPDDSVSSGFVAYKASKILVVSPES